MRALLVLLALGLAQADEYQPRDLGNRAVMVVFYFAPQTLEITHVDTYLFKDAGACEEAISQAGMIAIPHASKGDRIDIQCIAMHPPEHQPKESTKPTV